VCTICRTVWRLNLVLLACGAAAHVPVHGTDAAGMAWCVVWLNAGCHTLTPATVSAATAEPMTTCRIRMVLHPVRR
jgi:hypothetical protein